MVELKKVRDRIYVLPYGFKIKPSQLDQCLEVLGKFRFGSITGPELGTDGHVYMTQQHGVEFADDNDAVVFMMIVNDD